MKKQGIICTLSVVSLSLCALAFKTGDFVNAYAEENETSAVANDFYMESGASVRIDENAGVRFSAHISESKYEEIVNKAEGKEVKVVTIVNRADLGVTPGASKAVEYEHELPEAKDGEYTVTARVVYTALSEEKVKLAASVELEAQTYIVVGDDWESAYKAEQNDNVRSMRSVAYAALAAKEVTSAEVAKYLGTVSESESAALLNTDATEIDVSALSAEYGNYTAAYIGAKKIGEVKDGKIDLNEAYSGNAAKIVLMDSANNAVSVPLQYAGSLSAAVNSHKYGKTEAFADGTKITLTKDGKETETVVKNGKISAELPAGTYTATLNDVDGYLSGTVEIAARETNDSALTLEYKVFDLFNGWDEEAHDFSHVNDAEPTIGNNGKTLNVITRDTYDGVAASLWIKDGNSTNSTGTQGIVIKFADGKYMIARCEKLSDGNYKLQWMESIIDEYWNLQTAKNQWLDFQNPLTDEQKAAFGRENGLQLTLIRSGNVLTIYVNGEKIPGASVLLASEYASQKAQVGFFDYDSKENATWKFKIESDISGYDTSFEKLGAAGQAYTQSVDLTGDVWQAVKVKVNPGYTGEVRIGFVSDYGTDGTNYKKSVLYQNGNWFFQETDSWKGGDGLSDELKNALTGTGIYLAYHRNAETGEVKLYAAVSKEELENAIKEDKAVLTCNDYETYKDSDGNDKAKFSTKSITSVGIYFWEDEKKNGEYTGSYTASATGYGYGETSEEALKNLA